MNTSTEDPVMAELARQEAFYGKGVFPAKNSDRNGDYEYIGLTKRELFAMAAMQGLVANETWELTHVPNQTAAEAVEYADALLKELAK